ncbi:MAG: tRNA (guanine-N7)-methyltransferase [Bdellovibrionaceae bacterium]|mgnify:CR=1 FL=1|nr:tRNA (guanine-N7)-methyltransferase [Pseudobdellovibrionaceae bacterium]|tara:strand:+ start:84773 stop:85504 length:732 start_codon:yes stop_codon:yes gene_type:complete
MENAENPFDYIFNVRNYVVSKTRKLPYPNDYAVALLNDYEKNAFDEEKVLEFKGQWREKRFKEGVDSPLDLEIGTGNGFHLAHFVETNPERAIVGLELKYKPLIQTVRRCLDTGNDNFVVARYDARMIQDLFAEGELNNVYIHFPDPWAKKDTTLKHRLVQVNFLNTLYKLQKPGSFVDFKTDHFDYYLCVQECLKHTPYKVIRETTNLHQSEWADENFQTHFEKLWTSKGIKSNYIRFIKES